MTNTTTDEGVAGKQLKSAIRTGVGVAVGAGISWAARHGLHLDDQSTTTWLTPVCIGAYNAAVRTAEHRWPQLGWLLGAPRS